MSVKLCIEDVRARTLDFSDVRPGLPPLQGFFQFGWYPRTFTNPAVLEDCFFCDMHITYHVREWPRQPGPPHPGIFEDFFPTILGRLLGSGKTLVLFVYGDRHHFDEFKVIETILWPKNLRYVLLPNPPRVGPDPRIPYGAGRLVFEWPSDCLDYIVKEWFESPAIEIEGYVSSGSELPLCSIAELYFRPDNEERVREILRKTELGFRLWPDNNGLFVLTDKMNIDALEERLQISDLNVKIQEAARE